MEKLKISFMVSTPYYLPHAACLVESLRRWGGSLADSPILIMVPEDRPELARRLQRLPLGTGVTIASFSPETRGEGFPFKDKVQAAGAAEELSTDSLTLVWMDSDMMFCQSPIELPLPEGTDFGYRPVDITLIGSPLAGPVDDFWRLLYASLEVPSDRLFGMASSVDRNAIRPYFNAGMLSLRPELGILRAWRENFNHFFLRDEFEFFYTRHQRYATFMHQAVLTGTILSRLLPESLREMDHQQNYPLHLHHRYPADIRPSRLNDLISYRYVDFFEGPDWREAIQIDEPLQSFIERWAPKLGQEWKYED